MPPESKQVIAYSDKNGREPFTEWLNELRDVIGRKLILARMARMELGNYGDCAPIGNGLSEARIFFGPGYRVYFGEQGKNIIILLCGGDKGTQKQDIKQAQAYWKEHLSREKT